MLPKLVALLLGICVVLSYGKAPRVPWWQLKVAKSQGPNACIVEEVPELNKKYWTECKYWPVRKVCGKDTLIRYECCEGFKQLPDEEGCTGVKPLKNVLETARELGAKKFVKYLEDSGLAEELSRPGTFTLFAPFDHAFDGYLGTQISMKIQSFRNSGDNPVLRYHIANTKLPSKDFSGNVELESQYEGRKLRISKYSTGMEAVNCVLISRKDQEANNGIVHMIDSALDPTLLIPRDVAQVVVEDGRFARMSQAMQRCGFMDRLRESSRAFTVLAPSDEAFLKIPPARFEKMVQDRDSCVALLENHVIPHAMCMPVITEEYRAKSIGPARIAFDCDARGNTVENKRLSGELILGNNGVVYMLDDVLIPDRARTLLELAETRHLQTFVQLIRIAGLDDLLNDFGNYTLFAPSEEALYAIDKEILNSARTNRDLARKLVLYHALPGKIMSNSIIHNQNIVTLDNENSVRLVVYRKSYGLEDALIEQSDIEGMNGVLHIIDKVIFPATESAGDILRKSSNYSMFLHAMEQVLESDPQAIDLRRGQATSHYTFLVPSDDAFRAIGAARLRRLQTDTAYMTKESCGCMKIICVFIFNPQKNYEANTIKSVIKNHVSQSMMASQAFRPNLTYEVPTRQNALGLCKRNGKLTVNKEANVVKQDIVSSNGIIHIIDKLLLPED
ncbi:Transforming growth factor-beta-induced protein ig-h3 [Orchesella cincta]|uniref:Transforming growth factor-beta-induced protein ig-h3 n=1 Tax=Orchesella cincta TaxID=48709 RepID=A0A1D2MS89_ORCCI|nr:Transforming growth factor-beta-induced protein ig-h3 [Orchesella cincta]